MTSFRPSTDHPDEMDAFLAEQDDLEDLARVAEALPATPPPAALLTRVLASCQPERRLARFAEGVARLLDVSTQVASELLAALAREDRWQPSMPGVELCHVQGGPAVADAITGFVRVQPGSSFPEHEHVGRERVLILAGSYLEDGVLRRAGDELELPPGSRHRIEARPGPDLLYLGVVHGGLRIHGELLTPDDPRA